MVRAVGQMWERVLTSFSQLPTTPAWTEQAVTFRTAWMKRAQHFSPTGRITPKDSEPCDWVGIDGA